MTETYTPRASYPGIEEIASFAVPNRDNRACGVDLSYHNGNIDHAYMLAEDPPDFAFLRLGFGPSTEYYHPVIDHAFLPNYKAFTAASIPVGAYWYITPYRIGLQAQVAAEWAAYFNLPIGLYGDVEANGLTSSKVQAFLEAAQAQGVYTSCYMWRSLVGSPAWSTDYELWTAHWNIASNPCVPTPWQAWEFWQYSSSGSVAGIDGRVDINMYNGTVEQLRECYPVNGQQTPVKRTLTVKGDFTYELL